MIPKPVQYKRLALILITLWIGIVAATAQNDSCEQSTPFVYFDCETFDAPYPQEVKRCYSFTTSGDSVDFTFGYFAFCSDLTVEYTLYNALCDSLTSNSTGSFSIAPEVYYVVCGKVQCLTPGGIRELCATEMLTLPVEFLGLTAYPTDPGVVLSWATGSESGSDRFEVFRMRTEGDRGTFLASLLASGYSAGRTEYRWTDVSPEPGLRFYRLENVDLDGSRRILSIVPVTWTRPDRSSLGPFDLLGRRVRTD